MYEEEVMEGGSPSQFRHLQEELEQETQSRQLQEDLNSKLQDEYDILLKKLAEAELHIDQLRLRANVNINKRFIVSHHSMQSSTLQQDLLGSRALQAGNSVTMRNRNGGQGTSDSPPGLSEGGGSEGGGGTGDNISPSYSYASNVSRHSIPMRESFQDTGGDSPPDKHQEQLIPRQGFSESSLPDSRGHYDSPDSHPTSDQLQHQLSQTLSDPASDTPSQLSVGYISSQASAESQHLAQIFRIRSLQEQIASLKDKLNTNQTSFDELSDDLGTILENHELLTRNFAASKEQMNNLKDKYKDKAATEISRRKEVLENELLILADQLKDLDMLLRSKAQLHSTAVQSPPPLHPDSLSQSHPLPSPHPDDHSNKTFWHNHSHDVDNDANLLEDSLNSPSLPAKYLDSGNLDSTNSSGEQGLQSHSLSSDLDTYSQVSNKAGAEQEMKSPHLTAPNGDSGEGGKQGSGWTHPPSFGVGDNEDGRKHQLQQSSDIVAGVRSPSTGADRKQTKGSFRSRIPRRVRGSSLTSPPKLVPLVRRHSALPDAGVKRDSVSEIQLRKTSYPARLDTGSVEILGDIPVSRRQDGSLAPQQSTARRLPIHRTVSSTGDSHLPTPHAGSPPQKSYLKQLSSPEIGTHDPDSEMSSLTDKIATLPYHQENISLDQKARSSVESAMEGEGEGVAQEEHVAGEDETQNTNSKLTIATMDALRKELLTLRDQLVNSVPPSPVPPPETSLQSNVNPTTFNYIHSTVDHTYTPVGSDYWSSVRSPSLSSATYSIKSQTILNSLAPIPSPPPTPNHDLPTPPTSAHDLHTDLTTHPPSSTQSPRREGGKFGLRTPQLTDIEQEAETPQTTPIHHVHMGMPRKARNGPKHDGGMESVPMRTPEHVGEMESALMLTPEYVGGMELAPMLTPDHVDGIRNRRMLAGGMESVPKSTPEHVSGMESVPKSTPTHISGMESVPWSTPTHGVHVSIPADASDELVSTTHVCGMESVPKSTPTHISGLESMASNFASVPRATASSKGMLAGVELGHETTPLMSAERGDTKWAFSLYSLSSHHHDDRSGSNHDTPSLSPQTPPYDHTPYYAGGSGYNIGSKEDDNLGDPSFKHSHGSVSPHTPPSSSKSGSPAPSPPYVTPLSSHTSLTPLSSKPSQDLNLFNSDLTLTDSAPSLSAAAFRTDSTITNGDTPHLSPSFPPRPHKSDSAHSDAANSPLGFSFTESQLGSYFKDGMQDTSLSSFGYHSDSPGAPAKRYSTGGVDSGATATGIGQSHHPTLSNDGTNLQQTQNSVGTARKSARKHANNSTKRSRRTHVESADLDRSHHVTATDEGVWTSQDHPHSSSEIAKSKRRPSSASSTKRGSIRGTEISSPSSTRRYAHPDRNSDNLVGGLAAESALYHQHAGLSVASSLDKHRLRDSSSQVDSGTSQGKAGVSSQVRRHRSTSPLHTDGIMEDAHHRNRLDNSTPVLTHKYSSTPRHATNYKVYRPVVPTSHLASHTSTLSHPHGHTSSSRPPIYTPHYVHGLKSPSKSAPSPTQPLPFSYGTTARYYKEDQTIDDNQIPCGDGKHHVSSIPTSTTKYTSPHMPSPRSFSLATPPISPVHAHLFSVPPPPSPDLADSSHRKVYLYKQVTSVRRDIDHAHSERRGGVGEGTHHHHYHLQGSSPEEDKFSRRRSSERLSHHHRHYHDESDHSLSPYHRSTRSPSYKDFKKGLLRKSEDSVSSDSVVAEDRQDAKAGGVFLHSRDPLLVVNINKKSRGQEGWQGSDASAEGGVACSSRRHHRLEGEAGYRTSKPVYVVNQDLISSDSDYEGGQLQNVRSGIDLKGAVRLARQLRRRSEKMRGTLQMELTRQGLL